MNNNLKIFLLFILLILLLIADLVLGSTEITISELIHILSHINESNPNKYILLSFRIPKAITAILVGSALAVSGLQMQTIFRNPLAGPYILGISSGAGLGVAFLVLGASFFSYANIYSDYSIIIAAWIGAAAVLLLILAIAIKVKNIMTVLILGMLLGSIISAIVSVLQYFSNETMLKAYVLWTMGSLAGVTKSQLFIMIPAIIMGIIISFFSAKLLDGLLLGEDYAKTLGIKLNFARIVIFISTSILAGTITAFCGPIGFVGIVVPHIARILVRKSNHKLLIIISILIGSILLLLSDILSNLPQQSLPINSVTSLIGIPIIIWIILRNKKIML